MELPDKQISWISGGSMRGFQWEKYEAWRKHPLLQVKMRHMFPGFKYGVGAFAIYVVIERAMNAGKPKEHH